MKTNTLIEKLQAAHDHFTEVQKKLSKFGAEDTEPDFVYQDAVKAAMQGQPYEPRDANAWQLYSELPGADKAAVRLNHALQRVVNVISTAAIGESASLLKWAKQYLWRVD